MTDFIQELAVCEPFFVSLLTPLLILRQNLCDLAGFLRVLTIWENGAFWSQNGIFGHGLGKLGNVIRYKQQNGNSENKNKKRTEMPSNKRKTHKKFNLKALPDSIQIGVPLALYSKK